MKSNNTAIFYSSDHLQWSDDIDQRPKTND